MLDHDISYAVISTRKGPYLYKIFDKDHYCLGYVAHDYITRYNILIKEKETWPPNGTALPG